MFLAFLKLFALWKMRMIQFISHSYCEDMTCTCHGAPVEKILRDGRQRTEFKVYIVPLFRHHQTLKLQKYGIADPQLFQTGRVC